MENQSEHRHEDPKSANYELHHQYRHHDYHHHAAQSPHSLPEQHHANINVSSTSSASHAWDEDSSELMLLGTLNIKAEDQTLNDLTSISLNDTAPSLECVLDAAPSPSKSGDTITYVIQGHECALHLRASSHDKLRSVVSLRLHDEQKAARTQELVEEWRKEHDKPVMELGSASKHVHSVGLACPPDCLAQLVFSWQHVADPSIVINCLSTDFNDHKHGGAGGAVFDLAVTTAFQDSDKPLHSCECYLKVFRTRAVVNRRRQEDLKQRKRGGHVVTSPEDRRETTMLSPTRPSTSMPSTPSSIFPHSASADTFLASPQIQLEGHAHAAFQQPMTSSSSTDWSLHSAFHAGDTFLQTDLVSPISDTTLQSLLGQNDPPPVARSACKELTEASSAEDVQTWLKYHSFEPFVADFVDYTGMILLALSKDDCIKICGPAQGIRLYTLLHSVQPASTKRQKMICSTWTQTD